jgi:hypothetical protein
MSGASIFAGGTTVVSTANADNTVLTQEFITIQGQTLFVLTAFSYAPGTNSLRVFVNGVRQRVGTDFVETALDRFTLIGVEAGDIVSAEGMVGTTGASAALTGASAAASASAQSAEDAAAAYAAILGLSLPALPLSIANGGSGQGTKTGSFDALAPTTTKGDLIISNGADNVRFPVGTNGQALLADSTQPNGVRWGTSGLGVGGANTIVGSVTLTATSAGAQTVTPTGPGFYATLPDATTMLKGSTVFALQNNSEYDYGVKDSAGVQLGWIRPFTGCIIGLADNAAAAGVWDCVNLEKVGVTAQLISTSTGAGGLFRVPLDATRSLLAWHQGSTTVNGVVYDSATNTFGAVTVLVTLTASGVFAFCNGYLAGQAVIAAIEAASSTLNFNVITATGTTIAVTAQTAALASTVGSTSIGVLQVGTSGNFVVTYVRDGASYFPEIRAVSTGVGGVTIAIGAALLLPNSYGGVGVVNGTAVFSVTNAQVLVVSGNPTTLYATPYAVAGNVLTLGTTATAAMTSNSPRYIKQLPSGRFLVGYLNTSYYMGLIKVTGTVASISSVVLGSGAVAATSFDMIACGATKIVAMSYLSNVFHIQIFTDTAGTLTAGSNLTVSLVGTGAASFISVTAAVAKILVADGTIARLFSFDVSGTTPVLLYAKSLNVAVPVNFPIASPSSYYFIQSRIGAILSAGNNTYLVSQTAPITVCGVTGITSLKAIPTIPANPVIAGDTNESWWLSTQGQVTLQRMEAAA